MNVYQKQFSISPALSKSVGLFKITIDGWMRPQGDDSVSSKLLGIFTVEKPPFFKISSLVDTFTS